MTRLHGFAALAGLLLAGAAAAQEPGGKVAITKGKNALTLSIRGELVTRYLFDPEKQAKPIFWPLHAPGGVPVTRAWPMGPKDRTADHPHQQSAWFVHGDVIPEGLTLKHKVRGVEGVDFWSLAPGHGVIVCTKVEEPRNDTDHASVKTHNEWRTADGTNVLNETRTIHLYDLGKARLIVLDVDLHARTYPITFGDTKEAAMGVRINDQMMADKKGKGTITNAEGKHGEAECWGRLSAWCDYSGPVDGKEVGLTLLADPKNAQPSYWHVRGYGLMAANPFGRAKARFHDGAAGKALVHLPKDGHLRLRYGILLHTGGAEAGRVAEHYRRFVELRGQE